MKSTQQSTSSLPLRKPWQAPTLIDLDSDADDVANGAGGAIDGFNGRSTPTPS